MNIFDLSNAPNPFFDATTINFSVPTNSYVSLRVYNAIGELIATLYDGILGEGNYSSSFNGIGLAKGMYYYVLNEGIKMAAHGMVLVK